jgi:HEAT repeat protein
MKQFQNDSKKLKFLNEIEKTNNFTKETLEILDLLSKDTDSSIRTLVAQVLVLTDEPEGENILLRLLNDEDELVRVNACDSLCISSSIATINRLKDKLLSDQSNLVRSYAVLSIADIISDNNLPVKDEYVLLFQMILKTEIDRGVQLCLYKALYQFGDERYLAHLIAELNSCNYQNRCMTVNLLRDLINAKNKSMISSALSEQLTKEGTIAVKSAIQCLLQEIELNDMQT